MLRVTWLESGVACRREEGSDTETGVTNADPTPEQRCAFRPAGDGLPASSDAGNARRGLCRSCGVLAGGNQPVFCQCYLCRFSGLFQLGEDAPS